MPAPKIISIRIEHLAGYYRSLAQALIEAGMQGNQLDGVFSTCLHAQCVKCQIRLSSEEIGQVSLAEDPSHLSHPKLKRLRLGYCAREGCESYDYNIHFGAIPGVDWEIVARRAELLNSKQQTAAIEAEFLRNKQAKHRRRKQFVLRVILIAVLFLILLVVLNGRLPFLKKHHKYEIDPASVQSKPVR